jgi:hypothetical protein
MKFFDFIEKNAEYIAYGLLAVVVFFKKTKEVFMKYFNGKKSVDIKKNVNSDLEISKILAEMIATFSCVRILLYQRHNGGVYASKKSMQKVSATHEHVAPGYMQIMDNMKDIFFSAMPSLFENLLNKKSFVIYYNEAPEESQMDMDKLGVEAIKFKIIESKENDFIGYITMHFDENRLDEIHEIDEKELDRFINRIKTYLLK